MRYLLTFWYMQYATLKENVLLEFYINASANLPLYTPSEERGFTEQDKTVERNLGVPLIYKPLTN